MFLSSSRLAGQVVNIFDIINGVYALSGVETALA
jgi:hypothetical protein